MERLWFSAGLIAKIKMLYSDIVMAPVSLSGPSIRSHCSNSSKDGQFLME